MSKINQLPLSAIGSLFTPHYSYEKGKPEAVKAARIIDKCLGNDDGYVSLCEIKSASGSITTNTKKIAPVEKLLNSAPTELPAVACQMPTTTMQLDLPGAPIKTYRALYDEAFTNKVWKNGLGHKDNLIPSNINYANVGMMAHGYELDRVRDVFELRQFAKDQLASNTDACAPKKLTDHECKMILQNTAQLLGWFEIQKATLRAPSPTATFELFKTKGCEIKMQATVPTEMQVSSDYIKRSLQAANIDTKYADYIDHSAYVNVPKNDGTLSKASIVISNTAKVMYRVTGDGVKSDWVVADRSHGINGLGKPLAHEVEIPVGLAKANGTGVGGVTVPNGQVEIVIFDGNNRPKQHVTVPFGQPSAASMPDPQAWIPKAVEFVDKAKADVQKLMDKRHKIEAEFANAAKA